jgi:hypothetical protein
VSAKKLVVDDQGDQVAMFGRRRGAIRPPATKALASMAMTRLVERQVQRQLHRLCRDAVGRAFVAAAELFGHVLADRLA